MLLNDNKYYLCLYSFILVITEHKEIVFEMFIGWEK
jgi:hypothetical protein